MFNVLQAALLGRGVGLGDAPSNLGHAVAVSGDNMALAPPRCPGATQRPLPQPNGH